MTDFVVTITDPIQLEGITWAREQYNASLPPDPPPMPDEGSVSMAPMSMVSAATIDSDQEYVQWVMTQAAISYADQQLRYEHQKNYEDAVKSRSGGSDA